MEILMLKKEKITVKSYFGGWQVPKPSKMQAIKFWYFFLLNPYISISSENWLVQIKNYHKKSNFGGWQMQNDGQIYKSISSRSWYSK